MHDDSWSRPRWRRRSSWCWAVVLFTWSTPASAHGTDPNRIELVVHERTIEAVATVSSEYLAWADDDRDGQLSLPEVRAHQAGLRRAIEHALVIEDADGNSGAIERSDVSLPRMVASSGAASRADYVRFTLKLELPRAPEAVRLRADFAELHPVLVYATRAEAGTTPGVLSLVGAPVSAWLRPGHTELVLFERHTHQTLGTVLGRIRVAGVPTQAALVLTAAAIAAARYRPRRTR